MNKNIAFIPVRGGSKSIPNKNIKTFCNKPLVFWVAYAAQNSLIDRIIISTDSDEIESICKKFDFDKLEIYRRNTRNAQDHSSTEDALIECISSLKIDEYDNISLIQATSPFIEGEHINEAFSLFNKDEFDSVLSCVNIKRFLWLDDGSPLNYDYKNRPRRQDFPGDLVENGAIYISKCKSIIKSKNRLNGKIGIYRMPEYTFVEIDEPFDWVVGEMTMYQYHSYFKANNNKIIKLFATDVDGVLTDSGMYYSENGDELKKFNTRDGKGFELLRKAGIKTAIITSENTKIVENRAKKLKVDYLYQGLENQSKLDAILKICKKEGISIDQVAYIGDDLNCKTVLSRVGISACPCDAASEISTLNKIIVLNKAGGEGVVREFIELILNIKNDNNAKH